MEHINILYGLNELFLNVKPGGTYTSRLYRLYKKRQANGDTTLLNCQRLKITHVPNINFNGFRPQPKMAAFKRLRKTGVNGDREQLNSI
jgi:hypothetical protein